MLETCPPPPGPSLNPPAKFRYVRAWTKRIPLARASSQDNKRGLAGAGIEYKHTYAADTYAWIAKAERAGHVQVATAAPPLPTRAANGWSS